MIRQVVAVTLVATIPARWPLLPSKEGDVHRATIATLALTLLGFTGVAATDQWPQFRGPNAGVSPDDPALPDTWSEKSNVVWKTGIPGLGWSSPIVWDDHIIITSAISAGKEP